MITLQKNGLEILINPLGATIESLKLNGVDFLFPRQEIGDKKRGGIHLCSPLGKKPAPYDRMVQHGILRDVIWNCDESSEGRAKFSVTCPTIGDNCVVVADWKVEYLLLGSNTLLVDVSVKNPSTTGKMPIEFALHPYFNAPNGGTVRLPGMPIDEFRVDGQFGATRYKVHREVVVTLNGIGTVQMLMQTGFINGAVCIWSDGLDRYLCAEPVGPHPDKFNTPSGLFLKSGQTAGFRLTMEFQLEK